MSMWQATLALAEQQHHSSLELPRPGLAEPATRETMRHDPRSGSGASFARAWSTVEAAWRWLEQKRSERFTARRLRVTETISLGEKRFVSILQVDGVQMLIGGSAAGVQLLATLETPQTPETPPPSHKAVSV